MLKKTCEFKDVKVDLSVHAMEACGGNGGIVTLILKFGNRWM